MFKEDLNPSSKKGFKEGFLTSLGIGFNGGLNPLWNLFHLKISYWNYQGSISRQASLVPSKASSKRRLNDSREARTNEILSKPVESKTRTHLRRAKSGRTAGRTAGSSRTRCQQNCWPRRQGSVLLSTASTKRRLNVSPEARTSEILFKPNLSIRKPGHTRGGSGRAAHSGAAGHGGPGRMERRNFSSRRTQSSLVSSKASRTTVLNFSSEARTSAILYKPNAGRKLPVDNRFIRGLSAGREALCLPGCWPVVGINQILDPFGLIGLFTDSGGLRPSRICCSRHRHPGRRHTLFAL